MNEWSDAELDELIAEASVDAYDEGEQLTGLYAMIEDNLATPFEIKVLGVPVTVEHVEWTDANHLVAACRGNGVRQAIGLLELPLPSPPPEGAEWIAAYRRWARR
ncbi:MAG: hypothetical protein ACRDQA_01050 [Nocardioidaceae bacterium]